MRRTLPPLSAGVLLDAYADEASTPTAPETTFVPGPRALGLAQQESAFVPGRVLVRFAPGTDAPVLAGEVGASVDRVLAVGVHVLNVPAGAELTVVEALSGNPNVVFAEQERTRTFGAPAAIPVNGPYVGYTWDLDHDGSIDSSAGDFLTATGGPGADVDRRVAREAAWLR